MSYTILRPTVLFGKEDILINNIAWMLRRFPIFGVFGDGRYCLQPIYVDDLAKLAVQHGRFSENVILNAIGPETFTYRDLVRTLGEIIRRPRPIIRISPRLGYLIGSAVGRLVGDVTITWDEIKGLMSDLLHVNTPPTGTTKLTDWAPTHAATLGNHYASELARRRTS
jgi:nucleoside-diphosphate-sugar epimerase